VVQWLACPALSVVDDGFDPQSGKIKKYKIGICSFSTKHAVLRRKGKDWLVWNRSARMEHYVYPRTVVQWRSIDKIDNTKKKLHIFVIIFSYKKILFYAEIIKKR
jgi:hypothetical protein